MQRALLICGLVRNPAHFAAYLEGVGRLAIPGLRVIFSTWTGELGAYPGIAELLARLGAHVVEQDPPDLKLPGHILHQALSLELGLSLLTDDVFVLKTRPDICGVMDVVHFMQRVPEPLEPARLPCPFTHRVLVAGMFAAHPTYINDIIFAGLAGDLRWLAGLPMVFGAKYPRLAPEQWLWATAFAPGNAVLDAYLSVNPGLVFSDAARNAALRAVLLDSPLFARAIATSAILAHDALGFLFPDPQAEVTQAACDACTLEALLWDDLPVPTLFYHPLAMTNTLGSQGLAEAIYGGRLQASAFGARVAEAIAEYARGGEVLMASERPMLAAEAAQLAALLRERVGIGDAQILVETPLGSQVRRGPPAWRPGGDAEGSAALEQQINQMRRTIDALTARLAGR